MGLHSPGAGLTSCRSSLALETTPFCGTGNLGICSATGLRLPNFNLEGKKALLRALQLGSERHQ